MLKASFLLLVALIVCMLVGQTTAQWGGGFGNRWGGGFGNRGGFGGNRWGGGGELKKLNSNCNSLII